MNNPDESKYLTIAMGCVTLLWDVRRIYGDNRKKQYPARELNAMFEEGTKQNLMIKKTGIDNRKLMVMIDQYRHENKLPPRIRKNDSRSRDNRMRMAVARQMVLAWDGTSDVVTAMVNKLQINKRTAQRMVKDVKAGL